MIRVALGFAAAAAGVYLAIVAFFFFAQRALIFPAPTGARPPHGHLLQGDGFVAVWEPPLAADAPVVVHFHGNGEDLADAGPMIELLRGLGVGVLAVEYPGYGIAPGQRGEAGCYAAAEAAVRYLREVLGVAPGRIVLQGQSLGSGVAVELASRGLGARVVLISPYTSMAEVAEAIYPWLPARLLLRHRFESRTKAPLVAQPVLIVHGTEDEVVPYRLGVALSRLFPRATLWAVAGGRHNDLLGAHGAELRRVLGSFIGAR